MNTHCSKINFLNLYWSQEPALYISVYTLKDEQDKTDKYNNPNQLPGKTDVFCVSCSHPHTVYAYIFICYLRCRKKNLDSSDIKQSEYHEKHQHGDIQGVSYHMSRCKRSLWTSSTSLWNHKQPKKKQENRDLNFLVSE